MSIWKLLIAAFFVYVDGSHSVGVKNLVVFLFGGGFVGNTQLGIFGL